MKRLAVIFGGRSGEHEVSCHSAESILLHLDRSRYQVVPIMITRTGSWIVDGDAMSLPDAIRVLRTMDVVFPALHGPYGEDGTMQALLEHAGVPYVGNGILASAAGMDKEFTKKLLAAAGLRVADGVVLRPADEDVTAVARASLGLPVFVKPARAGSSLGVSKVTDWATLPDALRTARLADGKVLVEAAVPGREIDVAVLQHPDGRVVAGPPLEIRVAAGRAFFDYDSKYVATSTVFDIPARLDPATTALVQDRAVRAFHALECRGLLRVDMFLQPGAEPVINEVNTFPGFTAASQFPQMWRAAGLEFRELLDVLIETALVNAVGPPTAPTQRPVPGWSNVATL
jgi:D-alanine-D-alanine ligase